MTVSFQTPAPVDHEGFVAGLATHIDSLEGDSREDAVAFRKAIVAAVDALTSVGGGTGAFTASVTAHRSGATVGLQVTVVDASQSEEEPEPEEKPKRGRAKKDDE